MSPNGRATGQLVAGIILISLGALFLLDRFYAFRFGHFFSIWWPMLLIALGTWKLAQRQGRRAVGPLVLITIGAIFLIDNLNFFWWWRMGNLWPLILIAVGLGMMMGRLRHHGDSQPSGPLPPEPPTMGMKS
jgi:hypothetical protein